MKVGAIVSNTSTSNLVQQVASRACPEATVLTVGDLDLLSKTPPGAPCWLVSVPSENLAEALGALDTLRLLPLLVVVRARFDEFNQATSQLRLLPKTSEIRQQDPGEVDVQAVWRSLLLEAQKLNVAEAASGLVAANLLEVFRLLSDSKALLDDMTAQDYLASIQKASRVLSALPTKRGVQTSASQTVPTALQNAAVGIAALQWLPQSGVLEEIGKSVRDVLPSVTAIVGGRAAYYGLHLHAWVGNVRTVGQNLREAEIALEACQQLQSWYEDSQSPKVLAPALTTPKPDLLSVLSTHQEQLKAVSGPLIPGIVAQHRVDASWITSIVFVDDELRQVRRFVAALYSLGIGQPGQASGVSVQTFSNVEQAQKWVQDQEPRRTILVTDYMVPSEEQCHCLVSAVKDHVAYVIVLTSAGYVQNLLDNFYRLGLTQGPAVVFKDESILRADGQRLSPEAQLRHWLELILGAGAYHRAQVDLHKYAGRVATIDGVPMDLTPAQMTILTFAGLYAFHSRTPSWPNKDQYHLYMDEAFPYVSPERLLHHVRAINQVAKTKVPGCGDILKVHPGEDSVTISTNASIQILDDPPQVTACLPRVLAVEDTKEWADLYVDVVTKTRAFGKSAAKRITRVASYEEALCTTKQALEEDPFQIFILDLEIPKSGQLDPTHGLELFGEIQQLYEALRVRHKKPPPEIVPIVVSNYAGETDLAAAGVYSGFRMGNWIRKAPNRAETRNNLAAALWQAQQEIQIGLRGITRGLTPHTVCWEDNPTQDFGVLTVDGKRAEFSRRRSDQRQPALLNALWEAAPLHRLTQQQAMEILGDHTRQAFRQTLRRMRNRIKEETGTDGSHVLVTCGDGGVWLYGALVPR